MAGFGLTVSSSSKYAHSPVHQAVVLQDYVKLRKILSTLPRLIDPSEIHNVSISLLEEKKADAVSALIDRRDVPNRDTPLHLAVKIGDEIAVEMLMSAGADWSLQNAQGWSALQEAICNRQEGIAMVIVRHYQPLAWAKWCRRLPRLVSSMRKMRDFYMEISFHFESSVVPFVSRIAPSDTYKIWKRGANLRADMTLAGFDGFRIQRADQSVVFLGDGSEDGKVPSGSLLMISHKDKEVMNALDGAGAPASEAEVRHEVTAMSQTNIFRPGIDVTQAVLLPQMTWRRQERSEAVGAWKAKVYDMHNVVVSIKSRKVPGATTEDDFMETCNENETESEELDEILTEDEKQRLDAALNLDPSEMENTRGHRHSCYEESESPFDEKKGWFGGRRRRGTLTDDHKKFDAPRSSVCVTENITDLLAEPPSTNHIKPGRYSVDGTRGAELQRGNDETTSSNGSRRKDGSNESEYKKGLRPVLWLSSDFPLKTEELLPLLDILANKVKAVRRLRELFTTKLPIGTFPVKVAIPIVPTIRVMVTFTKFEELQPLDEFSTPSSSPTTGYSKTPSTASWFGWMKTPSHVRQTSSNTSKIETIQDPFAVPSDYSWITADAKKKRMQEKSRVKKAKNQQQRKCASTET